MIVRRSFFGWLERPRLFHGSNWVRSLRVVGVCVSFALTGIPIHAFTLLTYNVGGNGAEDWSTNAPAVRALGRQMAFLRPDIVTLQEVPFRLSHELTNFVRAFLPGYEIASGSGTDGFIRSAILSRHPIRRSQKWLDGVPLNEFGVDARFTRDLFEAEIHLPGGGEPVHVFTTHLKALSDATSAQRRAAEARAISNFFATVFLPAWAHRPYVLTGDLNEDVDRPPSSSRRPLQHLVNDGTGLRLLTPRDPVTGDERTFSARDRLTARFDYILPGSLLFSNVLAGQVFRTDTRSAGLPGVERGDSQTASDHLPLLVEFRDLAEPPLRLWIAPVAENSPELDWTVVPGRIYVLEASIDLRGWRPVATNFNLEIIRLPPPGGSTGGHGFYRVRESGRLP